MIRNVTGFAIVFLSFSYQLFLCGIQRQPHLQHFGLDGKPLDEKSAMNISWFYKLVA